MSQQITVAVLKCFRIHLILSSLVLYGCGGGGGDSNSGTPAAASSSPVVQNSQAASSLAASSLANSVSPSSVPATSVPASSIPASSVPASSSMPISSVSASVAPPPVSSTPASSSVPASSIPASSVPASSLPASSIPASSIPASSIPASSIPASSLPVSSAPVSSMGMSSRSSMGIASSSASSSKCISGNFMTVEPYSGNASLPDPELTVTCTTTKASVKTNAIPNHITGAFPNNGNPHSISAQNRTYPLSLNPATATSITSLSLGTMGVAVNGIAFEPMAAEYYNNDKTSGWQYEALANTPSAKKLGTDSSNAHVQPNGNYHYHGMPTGLVNLLNKGTAMSLIGYIGDGFPIYAVYGYSIATDATSGTIAMNSSYRLKTGTRSSGPGGSYDGTFVQDYEYVSGLGDLDECNGRFGVTPEYPAGIYHYYLTSSWPYIPRCFSGTAESYYTATPP
jgi:YHYH protein